MSNFQIKHFIQAFNSKRKIYFPQALKIFFFSFIFFSYSSNLTARKKGLDKIIQAAQEQFEKQRNKPIIYLDATQILNNNEGSTSLQNGKYYYENGEDTPLDFSNFSLWKNSLESTLNTFNQSRNDSVRIYVVAIKNLQLILPRNIQTSTNDTSLSFIQNIEKIKNQGAKSLSQLQKIFGSIIKGISQKSSHHTLILGVGHFFIPSNPKQKIEHYYSKYLDIKNTGALQSEEKRKSLRTILCSTFKDAPQDNPLSSIELEVHTLIDNIHCTLDGNCEEVQFPMEIEKPGIFSQPGIQIQAQNISHLNLHQSNVELFDLCHSLNSSIIAQQITSWQSITQSQQLKVKVFISTFDNPSNVLRQINEFRYQLPEKCLFIWYHYRRDGKMLCDVRISEDLNESILKKIDSEKRQKIFQNYIKEEGLLLSFIETIPAAIAKTISAFLDNHLIIPDKIFVKDHVEYNTLYKSLFVASLPEQLLQKFAVFAGQAILNGIDPLLIPDLGFAYLCGLWNGVIENTSAGIKLFEIANNSEKIAELANSLASFFQLGMDSILNILSEDFKSSYFSNNIFKRAHNYGKLTINVLSCFVGLGEAKALVVSGQLSTEILAAKKLLNVLHTSSNKISKSGLLIRNHTLSLFSSSGKWILKEIKNVSGQLINDYKNFCSKSFSFSSIQINDLQNKGTNGILKKLEDIYAPSGEKVLSLYKEASNGEIVVAGKNIWRSSLQIGTKIDYAVSIIETDLSLPEWIKQSFKDKIYYTVESTQKIKLYRDFGDQAFMDGSFCTTINNATREGLALHPSFQNSMRFKAELEIPIGEKMNIGRTGPYPPGDLNALPGGEDQVLLKTNYNHEWIKQIKDNLTGEILTVEQFKSRYPQLVRNL